MEAKPPESFDDSPKAEAIEAKTEVANRGRKHSEETKAKLRGKPVSEQQRATLEKYRSSAVQKSVAARTGKPLGEGHKAKISAGNLDMHLRKLSLWAVTEDALLGLSTRESAMKRDVHRSAVAQARRRMPFPKRWMGLYRHGEYLTPRHSRQFCEDLGLTQKQVAALVGSTSLFRGLDSLDKQLGGKRSRRQGRLLAAAYENVIEHFCLGNVREFLKSEVRQIQEKHPVLTRAFARLGEALKTKQLQDNPLLILEWVCENARREAAGEPIRTMLFFGLQLAEMFGGKPKIGDGTWASGYRAHRLAAELLAQDYRATRNRIEDVLAGTVMPIEPAHGLRQFVLKEIPQTKTSALPEKKRGKGGRTKLKVSEKQDAKIATKVSAETIALERGLRILRRSRKENAPAEAIHRKILLGEGFNSKQIDALLGSKTPIGAAQRYVALLLVDRKHPNGLRLQTVRSACSRYRKAISPIHVKD